MFHTPEKWQRITDVFFRVIHVLPDDRVAVLDNACTDDQQLRRDVVRLIDCDSRADDFLAVANEFNLTDFIDESRSLGEFDVPDLDGYHIGEQIGRGGQGAVYRAVQIATKREVAIKILLAGAGGNNEARRRFRREFELIAKLRHPNIVVVFDVGETGDGRPYAVMDFVNGQPLNHYLRDQAPPRMEVMRIFETICGAVAYAHENQVIHRDLKPSNVLVDHNGAPRILDFGLAKYLDDAGDSLVSVGILGTPRYMSPEQTKFKVGTIDKRTDVYALGVLLYESLTGGFPYPVDGEIFQVLRHVAQTEAAPFSRAWTRPGDKTASESIGRTGASEPFDRELETITLKALEKEPDRRYATAIELRDDIRRFLNREPIQAIPPTLTYRCRKFVKRRWASLSIGALVMVLASTALFYFQGWRRSEQRAQSEVVMRMMSDAAYESFSDPHAAIEKYQQICRLDPDNAEPWERMAYLHNRENEPGPALEVARIGLEKFPDSGPLHVLMGRLLLESDPAEAEVHRMKGAQLLPDDDFYGAMSLPDDQNEDAIRLLTRVLDRNGLDETARIERTWRYFKSGQFDQMLDDARHLTSNTPRSPKAWNMLGLALSRFDDRLNDALQAYDTSIDLAPEFPGAYVNRAELRFAISRHDEAFQDIEKALELQPGLPTALALKARLCVIVGRNDDAMACCDGAIASGAPSGLPYIIRGELRLLYELGYAPAESIPHQVDWYSRVVDDIREGLKRGPTTIKNYRPLEDLCPSVADFQVSVSDFLEDLDQGRAGMVHILMGDTYNYLDDDQRAFAAYSKAFESDKYREVARCRRALVYEKLGDLPRAIEDLNGAIELDPLNAIAYFDRARFYRILEKYQASLEDFAKARDLFRQTIDEPGRASATMKLASAYDPGECYWIAFRECGIACMLAGDVERGIRELENFVSDAPMPDPAPCLWLWELYSLRGNRGDEMLASKALETAAGAAASGKEKSAENIVSMLRGGLTPDAALSAAKTVDQRCEIQYYIGAAAAIRGDTTAAQNAFRECAESEAPDIVERYLASQRLK